MAEIYIWKSKLSASAYPQTDPTNWVTGDCKNLDPIFKRRIAAVGKAFNCIIRVNSDGGYRSYASQVKMYQLYKAGKLQATAAKPGTSRHGLALAIDTSSVPIRKAGNGLEKLAEETLNQYGLYHPYSNEPWHIEPIETKGFAFAQIQAQFAPVEISTAFQAKYKLSDSTMEFIEGLYFGPEIVRKRMATEGVLDLSDVAIDELDDYPYWPILKERLNVI